MIKIISLFAAVAISGNALAQVDWRSPADTPIKQCSLETITNDYRIYNITRQAEYATATLPLIQTIRQITEKAPNSNKPLIELLSKEDVSTFNQVNQRLQAILSQQYIDSGYIRNINVINSLVQIADKNYRFGTEVKEGSTDSIYQILIYLFRNEIEKYIVLDSTVVPSQDKCSLDLALYKLQAEGLDKLNSYSKDLDVAMGYLQSLLKKYSMETLDRGRVSKEELRHLDKAINETINPAKRVGQFVYDLGAIRLMATTSDLIYQSNKLDMETYGGDLDSIGKTIQSMTKANKIDPKTAIAITIWRKIDELIPSEVTNQNKIMLEAIQNIKK